jgi:hypothetical protein
MKVIFILDEIWTRLNVYCGPLLKSLPCASHNTEREMVWNIGPVNEYKAQGAIISFVDIIIRNEYGLL